MISYVLEAAKQEKGVIHVLSNDTDVFVLLVYWVYRAQLQIMLWKAADQQAPPDESADITRFGWNIQNGIPIPGISQGDPAPPKLIDVLRCQCRAQDMKCSTEACGCHKEHLSCTSYCNCSGEQGCCNPHTARDDLAGDEEDVEMEDVEEEDFEDQEDDAGAEMEGVDQDSEGHEDIEGSVVDTDYEWE